MGQASAPPTPLLLQLQAESLGAVRNSGQLDEGWFSRAARNAAFDRNPNLFTHPSRDGGHGAVPAGIAGGQEGDQFAQHDAMGERPGRQGVVFDHFASPGGGTATGSQLAARGNRHLAVPRSATTIDVHRGLFIFPEEALSLWPRRWTRPRPLTPAQARARLRWRRLLRCGAPEIVEVGGPAWLSAPRRWLIEELRRAPARWTWAKRARKALGSAW